MAAHPQGADNLPSEVLDDAFKRKLQWAQENRAKFHRVYWCTQMCNDPNVFLQFDEAARKEWGNTLDLYCGISGPADVVQLAKYAKMSGVSNSINFFKNKPSTAWSLLKSGIMGG